MLFVPSINGKSHCPEEETDLPDIALGVEALIQGLLRLDREL
jgi:N-carbamoyl-L-amino-acid hydrolase